MCLQVCVGGRGGGVEWGPQPSPSRSRIHLSPPHPLPCHLHPTPYPRLFGLRMLDRSRYASCGHAGGLSCSTHVLCPFESSRIHQIFYSSFIFLSATVEQASKLWKHIEPHLKKALNTVYLREVSR